LANYRSIYMRSPGDSVDPGTGIVEASDGAAI
jgi:hypothetical protein